MDMRWDARGTIALLVSALVGVTAGVVVGLTTGGPAGSNADPGGRTSSPSESSSPDDPLDLGIPLVNVPCNGLKILVVGWGEEDDLGELSNAVSANRGDNVKYLETSKSCNTVYGDENQVPPTYAVYLGPYDRTSKPCSLQMTPDHARDTVTNLKPGVKVHVPCLCVIDPVTFPKIVYGATATTRDGIYIRALQQMLVDIDQNPQKHVNGRYDAQTRAMITPLQRINAITAHPPGSVGKQTWQMVRDRGCLNYDF